MTLFDFLHSCFSSGWRFAGLVFCMAMWGSFSVRAIEQVTGGVTK